jgi:Bax inhibitor 1
MIPHDNFPTKRPTDLGSSSFGDWNILRSMTHLSPAVQTHLVQVYKCLVMALGCTSLGAMAYGHHALFQGGSVTFFCGLACLFWLAMTEPRPEFALRRMLLLAGFAFLEGLSLGPFLSAVILIDPSLLILGLVGATLIFICFSLSAMMSRRRSWLYLGGFLSSATTLLFWLSIGSMIFRSSTINLLEIYLGCILMCLFVLYDTQLIIERATRGNRDAIWHAAELFVDFVNLSIHLITILVNQNEKKERESRKRNSRS